MKEVQIFKAECSEFEPRKGVFYLQAPTGVDTQFTSIQGGNRKWQ